MVLELVGLSPAHAHDDRSRYEQYLQSRRADAVATVPQGGATPRVLRVRWSVKRRAQLPITRGTF